MVDPKELEVEIARLEYADSSYPNYAKLANLYVIQDRLNRKNVREQAPDYSSATAPTSTTVPRYGNTEFLEAIEGRDVGAVLDVIDELMDTLQVANPRVYNGVMRKIKSL